jgi:hypothetical protein
MVARRGHERSGRPRTDTLLELIGAPDGSEALIAELGSSRAAGDALAPPAAPRRASRGVRITSHRDAFDPCALAREGVPAHQNDGTG